MACDSCWADADSGMIDNLSVKIGKLKSGALIGQAGDNDARDVIQRFERLTSPKNFPMRKELHEIRVDFLGLLVLPNKRIFKIATTNKNINDTNEDIGIWEINRPYAAVGSGGDVAMGAMAAGASARKAAQVACQLITSCRAPVHTRSIAVQPRK